jgi:hypothetical protein
VLELLQKPHIQGLLYSHDIIAQKDYLPKLPDMPSEGVPPDEEEEETIKIVQLVKSSEPLVNKFILLFFLLFYTVNNHKMVEWVVLGGGVKG